MDWTIFSGLFLRTFLLAYRQASIQLQETLFVSSTKGGSEQPGKLERYLKVCGGVRLFFTPPSDVRSLTQNWESQLKQTNK